MKLLSLRSTVFLIVLAAIAFGAAALPLQSTAPNAPAMGEWLYRRPVVISNPGQAELRDFQVRVALDATNFDFEQARSDGGDLRFADEDGRRYLPHWVERYDAAAKHATVWVKVPYLPAAGQRTIYLYFANPPADDLSSGGRTFEMFDDFGRPGLGYYEFGPPTTIMIRTEAWETQAPHTLSVVEWNRDGYRYWGYYGLADCGGIGLARSNDLVHWEKITQPLLNRDGERWPAVLRWDDRLYMIYDRDHCGTSHLVMRTSADGVNFDPQYRVIVPQEAGVRNQNPALFRDPDDGMFYLYWFRGGNEAGYWQIKARRAWRPEGLADASSERVLIDVPYELAAPNMMFHDGTYFLSTEVNENAWKTKIYAGPSPLGPFTPLPDAPQLADNQACLFQHIFDGALHGYICKDTGVGWVLNHRRAELSAGRSDRRRLDPGVWTPYGGAWEPIALSEALGVRTVLSATGRGLLMTALRGSDYTFEVRGRLQDRNGKWGVALRAQDADQHYRVELERLVNGGAYIRVYRIVGGERAADLAAMSRLDADPLIWLKLTIAVQGNRMRIDLNDQGGLLVVDPEARFTAGHSALWVEGSAQFDDVVWRKSAALEPAAAVGAREQRSEATTNWLTLDRTAPAQASTTAPGSADDLMHQRLTLLAALLTLVALGIMALGLARKR
jgi:hypothetical protein